MDQLHESSFAYPAMRKYPLYTKEAASKSFEAFCRDKKDMSGSVADQISKNFEKAASFYDIVLEEPSEEPELDKTASICFTTDAGTFNMTKIASQEDAIAAADWMLDNRNDFSRELLKEPALYILKEASEHDADLGLSSFVSLARIAGIGVGAREEIQHEFEKRATVDLFDPAGNESFWKFAKTLRSLSDEDFYKEANLNMLCNTMEEIDKLYSNDALYGKQLKSPEETLFGQNLDSLIKEASDLVLITSIDTTISKTALLERGEKAKNFLKTHFDGFDAATDDQMVEKVASLGAVEAKALLDAIE